MIVDSHPPVPTSAVFDPATLMRNKNGPGLGQGMSTLQQQQARQRYWSGMTLGRPSSMQDAIGNGGGGKNGSKAPQQQWSTPVEKEIYTPFKSVSGRATPLDDPYSANPRAVNSSANEYMPAPQDPRERPPSRAMSINNGMMGGGIYGRRLERKSEGSVVYQPLTPTNHASAWSNSLMFNKPHGAFDPFDQGNDMPMGASAAVPPLPHIQTLPRQLPLAARNANFGPPEEPTHNPRQQIPQPQPFVTMNGYVPQENHQLHKTAADMTKTNRVTVVPNGTVIGTSSSHSSNDMTIGDMTSTGPIHDESDGQGDKSKRGRYLSRHKKSIHPSTEGGVMAKLVIVEKVAILHILLGACLFALGIARLLLLSTWGLGIELVYGVYVVLMGMLGVIGCRRRHYCSVAACIAMSALSCILAIPPFVTGLLVTIPDSFRTVDPKHFTSAQEPYGVDILLSVICLLELIMSIATSGLGCSVVGRMMSKWKEMEQVEHVQGQPMSIGKNQPIFHTSVNITHPGMMKN